MAPRKPGPKTSKERELDDADTDSKPRRQRVRAKRVKKEDSAKRVKKEDSGSSSSSWIGSDERDSLDGSGTGLPGIEEQTTLGFSNTFPNSAYLASTLTNGLPATTCESHKGVHGPTNNHPSPTFNFSGIYNPAIFNPAPAPLHQQTEYLDTINLYAQIAQMAENCGAGVKFSVCYDPSLGTIVVPILGRLEN